jgi:outer membrane protein TolC
VKIFLFFLLVHTTLYGVSIQEAWDLVENTNETIQASKTDVTIATLKKNSAQSMYLPQVSITGSYTHVSEPIKYKDEITLNNLPIPLGTIPIERDLSKKDIFFANLHMFYPLFTGGKIDAAQTIYKAKTDEAHTQLELKKDEKFLKLVQYYYGVVVAKALYKTLLQSQKALQLHYENAKKLYENAQIAKIELLNAQVKYENAKTQTLNAKHNLQVAHFALKTLTHKSIQPTTPLKTFTPPYAVSHYMAKVEQNSHALEIFTAKKTQASALKKIQQSQWYPEVVGYGNYNLYKDDTILSDSIPQWFAGVMVKFSLLERHDRNQEIKAAQLLGSKIEMLQQETRKNLTLLSQKTYNEMVHAYEEYNALKTSLKLAKENVKLRELSFQEGLGTSEDVVSAQTFLLAIQTKQLNAAYTFTQKLALLSVLSGSREEFFALLDATKEIK